MTRTEFLIANPQLVDTLALRQGVKYADLEDFRQEVILQSITAVDAFNPELATLCTYAGNFVKKRAVNYLKKMRRFPEAVEDLSWVANTPLTASD